MLAWPSVPSGGASSPQEHVQQHGWLLTAQARRLLALQENRTDASLNEDPWAHSAHTWGHHELQCPQRDPPPAGLSPLCREPECPLVTSDGQPRLRGDRKAGTRDKIVDSKPCAPSTLPSQRGGTSGGRGKPESQPSANGGKRSCPRDSPPENPSQDSTSSQMPAGREVLQPRRKPTLRPLSRRPGGPAHCPRSRGSCTWLEGAQGPRRAMERGTATTTTVPTLTPGAPRAGTCPLSPWHRLHAGGGATPLTPQVSAEGGAQSPRWGNWPAWRDGAQGRPEVSGHTCRMPGTPRPRWLSAGQVGSQVPCTAARELTWRA